VTTVFLINIPPSKTMVLLRRDFEALSSRFNGKERADWKQS